MGDGTCCHYCRRYRCICETGWRVIYRLKERVIQVTPYATEEEARNAATACNQGSAWYTATVKPPRDPELRAVLEEIEGTIR